MSLSVPNSPGETYNGLPSVLFDESLRIISEIRTRNYERVFQRNSIPGKKPLLWINNPQHYFSIDELNDDDRISSENISVFVSGCNEEYAEALSHKKYKIFMAAKEAVLNTSEEHFDKRSMKELLRVGKRNGTVKEIPYSIENNINLELFKSVCAHGEEPQLKYFFNDQFLPGTRLFVFIDKNDKWAGAILTAKINDKHIRTDLLLRRKDAPKGVMELLIYSILNQLKSEGAESWSLGDVPYVVYNSKIFSEEFFVNAAGRKMRFAYNYLGLYNFKNKFNPEWRNSYICTNSKHSFLILLKIAWVSNLVRLIFYKAKNYS